MKKTPLLAFALVSVAYIISRTVGYVPLTFITKPLLMPLLAWWFATETRHHPTRFLRGSILGGLAFATLGDTLLLFDGPLFFILGLLAFLLTHLFYIGAFFSIAAWKNGYLRLSPGWILPFAVFLVGLVRWLWPGIPGGMKLPVSVYSAVITTMVLSIVNLKGHLSGTVFRLLLAGGLLFMLSDCLLALHKFGHLFEEPGLAIMATYLLGQYLIVRGVCEREVA